MLYVVSKIRVQIIQEAQEETSGLSSKPDERRDNRGNDRRRIRGFNS